MGVWESWCTARGTSRKPASGTSWASMPVVEPTNTIESRSWPASTRASATASAGRTWPAVPPPAMTANTRPVRSDMLVACGHGLRHRHGWPCRATFSEQAGGRHGDQQRRAAERDERQRHAGDRQQPDHRPDVDDACTTIHAVMPPASSMPNRSGARSARADAEDGERRRTGDDEQARRRSPSSSPMMAKMKSVWASGRKPHFARLSPRPTPVKPPDAMPTSDCESCQRRRWRSRFGWRKHESRARRTDELGDEDHATTRQPAGHRASGTSGVPADEQHREHDRRDHDAVPRSGCAA